MQYLESNEHFDPERVRLIEGKIGVMWGMEYHEIPKLTKHS
jgi:hypothetical protein